MNDNRSIIEKADLAVSDLISGGGYLQPAQAAKFIRLLIKESSVMNMASVKPMKAPKELIEKIRFGSRVLRAGTEAVALPVADRVKPDLTKTELDAKLFKAETRISYEALEDSIERGQLKNTIMQELGKAVARDMDEVIVNGDTASADTFLAQLDGLLKQTTSNVTDALIAPLDKDILRDMLKAMPSEWLRDKKAMRFITSVDALLDYRNTLADRETVAGDRWLTEDVPIMYSGVPLVDAPLFPENLGAGSNETNVLLSDPKNIQVGIWRQIRLETQKDAPAGVLIIVATLRFDVKWVEETAAVKCIKVKVA